MSILEKIYNLIANLSGQEIDSVTQEELKKLSEEQIHAYIHRAQELGRNYYLNMVVDIGLEGKHEYEERNGTFTKWLKYNRENKEWEIVSGAGLIPGLFAEPPKMVAKETFDFDKEMAKKGVPNKTLAQFEETGPITS